MIRSIELISWKRGWFKFAEKLVDTFERTSVCEARLRRVNSERMRRICIETSERGSKSNIFSLNPLGLDTFSPNYSENTRPALRCFEKSVYIFMNHPEN
jgi:hypothetical protein